MTQFAGLPERATFTFDFGTFVDTSLEDWPNGYRELFLYGRMDQKELAVWRRIIRPGDAVVDGGANYGYWTLVASRLIGPTGRVFSFEANPPTASRLEANVNASNATNVKIYNKALAATTGIATINAASANTIGGHASLRRHTGSNWIHSTEISTVTADETAATETWPKVRLIKLDIEGAELSALKGMRTIIKRDKPYLTVEWNVNTAKAFGHHPRDIITLLASFGYSLASTMNGTLRPTTEPSEQSVAMMWFKPVD